MTLKPSSYEEFVQYELTVDHQGSMSRLIRMCNVLLSRPPGTDLYIEWLTQNLNWITLHLDHDINHITRISKTIIRVSLEFYGMAAYINDSAEPALISQLIAEAIKYPDIEVISCEN